MAEIIIVSDFVQAKTARVKKQSFSGVLAYNANELKTDAKRFIQEPDEIYVDLAYSGMNRYMSDIEKSSGLFTRKRDYIGATDEKMLADTFDKSQEKDGNLWRFVVSFENEALEKYGVFQSKTRQLNETRLKNAVRIAMNDFVKREGFHDANFVWTGAIHHNTDNIHVHIAGVERDPHRFRGVVKYSSIEKVTSHIINALDNRKDQLAKIDTLYRENIVAKRKAMQVIDYDQHTVHMMAAIREKLPSDKRKWKYVMNALNTLRPEIDALTKHMLDRYFPEAYQTFEKALHAETENNKKRYGESDRNQDTYRNKLGVLYSTMGNATLKELLRYEKEHVALVKDADGNILQKRSIDAQGQVVIAPMPPGDYIVERESDDGKQFSDGLEFTIPPPEMEESLAYDMSLPLDEMVPPEDWEEAMMPVSEVAERSEEDSSIQLENRDQLDAWEAMMAPPDMQMEGSGVTEFPQASQESIDALLQSDVPLFDSSGADAKRYFQETMGMNPVNGSSKHNFTVQLSSDRMLQKQQDWRRKTIYLNRSSQQAYRAKPKFQIHHAPKVSLNRLKKVFGNELEQEQNQAIYNYHVEQNMEAER
ncbi:MobP2 family relaxase [Listeria booriae]|uniref:Relaxase n=1 Tax=Listeria booriae TaxID=1552123 RepID=A0A7X1A976_9LIST|nr:MobP2 family relaxase [Listeria booriae]MBC1228776.1 hypothetical protein [Listeria booriae]MBC2373619.1 hypothetical protein [Listeria booriae]MBC2388758.1 hypothetical protein [Listeria booriae]